MISQKTTLMTWENVFFPETEDLVVDEGFISSLFWTPRYLKAWIWWWFWQRSTATALDSSIKSISTTGLKQSKNLFLEALFFITLLECNWQQCWGGGLVKKEMIIMVSKRLRHVECFGYFDLNEGRSKQMDQACKRAGFVLWLSLCFQSLRLRHWGHCLIWSIKSLEEFGLDKIKRAKEGYFVGVRDLEAWGTGERIYTNTRGLGFLLVEKGRLQLWLGWWSWELRRSSE